jgi:hypothetical protein
MTFSSIRQTGEFTDKNAACVKWFFPQDGHDSQKMRMLDYLSLTLSD